AGAYRRGADDEPERPLAAIARGVACEDGHAPVALGHRLRAVRALEANVLPFSGSDELELDPAARALGVLHAPVDAASGLRGAERRRGRVANDRERAEVGRAVVAGEVG